MRFTAAQARAMTYIRLCHRSLKMDSFKLSLTQADFKLGNLDRLPKQMHPKSGVQLFLTLEHALRQGTITARVNWCAQPQKCIPGAVE